MAEAISQKQIDELFQTALQVRNNAYTPVSNYKVGAALFSESGKIFSGCNVESETLTLSTHAEMNAIDTMIASGEKKIKAILIVSVNEDPGFPCALCRQKIAEFSDDAIVFTASPKKKIKKSTVRELYPQGFYSYPR